MKQKTFLMLKPDAFASGHAQAAVSYTHLAGTGYDEGCFV